MINTVGIVGLGAVGGMYAKYLTEMLDKEYVKVIADKKRIDKYKTEGIICNGSPFDYNFAYAEDKGEKVDLLIIATKFHHLDNAIDNARNYVGDNTLILSAINGIYSEDIIGDAFGKEKVLYCVAQGMDAIKKGNEIIYSNLGKLAFGERNNSEYSKRVSEVVNFFERSGFPYEVPLNMDKRMWGKFMMNVGLNQVSAVYDVPYGGVQDEGEPREMMIKAMKEVMAVSEKVGINLNDEDLNYWIKVTDTLTYDSMPSMRQDVLAKRKTEVEVFGGAVMGMGKKYGVATPVNDYLVKEIYKIEGNY